MMEKNAWPNQEGYWILQWAMIKAVIPLEFAYDIPNYAIYPPTYYNQMLKLPMEHPEVYMHLKNGVIPIQLGTANTFGLT